MVFDGDWALQSPKVQNPRGTYVQIFLGITSLGFHTCLFSTAESVQLCYTNQYGVVVVVGVVVVAGMVNIF